MVQNPLLHTITQLKSKLSCIIRCTYGQQTQKVGASWGVKLYGAKIGQKQAKNGVFRHFRKIEEFIIYFLASFGLNFKKCLFY